MEKEYDQLKRARKTALVLASVSIIALLTVVYGFVQKNEYDRKIESLTQELELCKEK